MDAGDGHARPDGLRRRKHERKTTQIRGPYLMNTPYLDKLLAMSDEELAALEGVDGNRSSRRVGINLRFTPAEPDK